MSATNGAQARVREILRARDIPPQEAGAILLAELVNYTGLVPMAHRMEYAEKLAAYFLDRVRETLE
jgi:hypothetical protein